MIDSTGIIKTNQNSPGREKSSEKSKEILELLELIEFINYDREILSTENKLLREQIEKEKWEEKYLEVVSMLEYEKNKNKILTQKYKKLEDQYLFNKICKKPKNSSKGPINRSETINLDSKNKSFSSLSKEYSRPSSPKSAEKLAKPHRRYNSFIKPEKPSEIIIKLEKTIAEAHKKMSSLSNPKKIRSASS